MLEVNHFNHGMEADNNFVTLADVEPDTTAILLTDSLAVDDQVISVASTSEFATFGTEYQQLKDLLRLIVKLFSMIVLPQINLELEQEVWMEQYKNTQYR